MAVTALGASKDSLQMCVTNVEGGVCRDIFIGGAVREMEDCWPSGVGLRGRALNRPVLRWLKTVVVSDREKARLIASGGDREDVPERAAGRRGVAVEASLSNQMASKSGVLDCPRMSLAGARVLARWCPA